MKMTNPTPINRGISGRHPRWRIYAASRWPSAETPAPNLNKPFHFLREVYQRKRSALFNLSSSTPPAPVRTPCHIRGYSSVGRAPALQAGCLGFESPCLHFLHLCRKHKTWGAPRTNDHEPLPRTIHETNHGPIAQLVRAPP